MNEPYKEPTTCQKVVDYRFGVRQCGKPGMLRMGLFTILCDECAEECARVIRAAWGIE